MTRPDTQGSDSTADNEHSSSVDIAAIVVAVLGFILTVIGALSESRKDLAGPGATLITAGLVFVLVERLKLSVTRSVEAQKRSHERALQQERQQHEKQQHQLVHFLATSRELEQRRTQAIEDVVVALRKCRDTARNILAIASEGGRSAMARVAGVDPSQIKFDKLKESSRWGGESMEPSLAAAARVSLYEPGLGFHAADYIAHANSAVSLSLGVGSSAADVEWPTWVLTDGRPDMDRYIGLGYLLVHLCCQAAVLGDRDFEAVLHRAHVSILGIASPYEAARILADLGATLVLEARAAGRIS